MNTLTDNPFCHMTDEDRVTEKVLFELLASRRQVVKVAILIHQLFALLLFYFLKDKINFYILLSWFIASIANDIFACVYLYKFRNPPKVNVYQWRSFHIVGGCLVSFIWGGAGFLLMPKNEVALCFFIMVILFIYAASIGYEAMVELKTGYINVIFLLLPLTVWCFTQNILIFQSIGLVLILYLCFLMIIITKGSRLINQSLTLRFKNIVLNERLEKSNQILEQKVTERTQELAQAKREAEAANKAKTEFLGIISHELRTPLRTINSGVKGLNKVFPALLDGYLLAKDANLPVAYLTPQLYQRVPELTRGIEQETDSVFSFLKMILTSLGQIGLTDLQRDTKCAIAPCIKLALARYPFVAGEKDLIDWRESDDFIFAGNDLLMVHVLFNLLKNALQYIGEAGKGRIELWTELGDKYNSLHFKDTAKGIAADALPKIFDRYYSKSAGGTGIGLDFCRMVMTNFGGTIACVAQEHQYTEFIMTFPTV